MSGSIRSRLAKQRKFAGDLFFENRGQISFAAIATKMEEQGLGAVKLNVLENWMEKDKWQELLNAPAIARKMPHDPGAIAEAVKESSEKLMKRVDKAKARGGVVLEADVVGVIVQTHRCVLALAQTLAQRMMDGLSNIEFKNESQIAMGCESLERVVEASQKVNAMLADTEARKGVHAQTIPNGAQGDGLDGEIIPPPIRRPADARLATAANGFAKAAVAAEKKG